jgi:phytoene dehydrogenase-like protein
MHDVVVIGGGLGGLLTAAILGRRGRKVLVLERAGEVGGRLRSTDIDGYVLDAGAYLWPNLYLDRALAAAGAADAFRGSIIPTSRLLRVFVEGGGGAELPFPWPGLSTGPFAAAAQATLRADAPTFAKLCELWERLAQLADDEVAALRHVPVRDALPRFTTDAAVAESFRRNVMLFGSIDPDSASMAECIALRRRPRGGPTPKPESPGDNAVGGVRALAVALRDACQAAGVTIATGWEVERIIVRDGAAAGVEARPAQRWFGEEIAASAVVCNAPVWQSLSLLPAAALSPDFVADARACDVVGGVIAAAFAFEGMPTLRATGTVEDFPGWTRLLIGPQARFGGGMVWTTLHAPRNAPPGHHVVQAMRLSSQADVADASRVAEVHAAFRHMLDEMYADVDARLRRTWTWTTRDGSEYMIHSARRPPVRARDVANLFYVGETTDVPAIQMDAAALSALQCAEMIP